MPVVKNTVKACYSTEFVSDKSSACQMATEVRMTDAERKEQFAELLEKIQQQLFGFIFALVRNLGDAQDIYQQTCLVLWERFDDFAGRSEYGTWACAIARNKVMDLRKRKLREIALFSSGFEEHIAALQINVPAQAIEDRRTALHECLQKLPQHQRELIRDCYGSDNTVSQVALQIGRQPQSVHNTLRRIRVKLLECIDRNMARDSPGGSL